MSHLLAALAPLVAPGREVRARLPEEALVLHSWGHACNICNGANRTGCRAGRCGSSAHSWCWCSSKLLSCPRDYVDCPPMARRSSDRGVSGSISLASGLFNASGPGASPLHTRFITIGDDTRPDIERAMDNTSATACKACIDANQTGCHQGTCYGYPPVDPGTLLLLLGRGGSAAIEGGPPPPYATLAARWSYRRGVANLTAAELSPLPCVDDECESCWCSDTLSCPSPENDGIGTFMICPGENGPSVAALPRNGSWRDDVDEQGMPLRRRVRRLHSRSEQRLLASPGSNGTTVIQGYPPGFDDEDEVYRSLPPHDSGKAISLAATLQPEPHDSLGRPDSTAELPESHHERMRQLLHDNPPTAAEKEAASRAEAAAKEVARLAQALKRGGHGNVAVAASTSRAAKSPSAAVARGKGSAAGRERPSTAAPKQIDGGASERWSPFSAWRRAAPPLGKRGNDDEYGEADATHPAAGAVSPVGSRQEAAETFHRRGHADYAAACAECPNACGAAGDDASQCLAGLCSDGSGRFCWCCGTHFCHGQNFRPCTEGCGGVAGGCVGHL